MKRRKEGGGEDGDAIPEIKPHGVSDDKWAKKVHPLHDWLKRLAHSPDTAPSTRAL